MAMTTQRLPWWVSRRLILVILLCSAWIGSYLFGYRAQVSHFEQVQQSLDPLNKQMESYGAMIAKLPNPKKGLEDLEKSQLDSLVARVVATGQYQEEIISYYEREMAQVAAPVLVEGRVVSIAWIRSLLPSSLKTVTEEPKFQGTATHKAPGQ